MIASLLKLESISKNLSRVGSDQRVTQTATGEQRGGMLKSAGFLMTEESETTVSK